MAFTAGSFITLGAVLSVALSVSVEPIGVSRLLLGLGFSAGFIMVILSGSAFFIEINVLLPEMFLSRPRDLCRRCWRFWLIVYLRLKYLPIDLISEVNRRTDADDLTELYEASRRSTESGRDHASFMRS